MYTNKTFSVLFFLSVTLNFSFSQGNHLQFRKNSQEVHDISQVFLKSQVLEFDASSLYHKMVSQRSLEGAFTFTFGENEQMTFNMEEVHLITDETVLYTLVPGGKQKLNQLPDVKTYKGTFADGREGYIRLTLHGDFLYANIKNEEKEYFIEPLKYYDHSSRAGKFVFYNTQDLNPKHKSKKCFRPDLKDTELHREHPDGLRMVGDCYKVKLALLADYSMFNDPSHLGLDAVIDHVIGVMNNVQANYEYNGSVNFTNGVNYEISEVVVSTCATCDPISTTQNPTLLLTEFSNWVDMNGFYHPFHAAHFWTNRDFIGPTIGLAFQQGNLYCQNRARAVLEDWSSNAALLKTMVAHEVAHNFNGVHDGTTGMILSPTVTVTDTWSNTSKTTISGQIVTQSSCLTLCAPPACAKLENVQLNNITTSSFDISWSPTAFQLYSIKIREAGASNFIQELTTINNSITLSPPGFAICKSYDIFIYNDCGSSGMSAPQRALFKGLTTQGCSDFTPQKRSAWIGSSIGFINNSLNANSWNWNFGNGQTATSQTPSINYTTSGEYDVSLTVNGGAHTMLKEDIIRVLPNKTTPYALNQGGNFESNALDFGVDQVEGTVSLWEYGTSNIGLTTQGNAWKTRLNSNIPQITTKSALLTPRFNFASYTNYNLSFDLSMQTLFCNAPFAVQLQYSTDDGATWTRLGGNSFYDAYPGAFCTVATQVFSDGYGWSLGQNYSTKSIDVSFLSGQTSVVFRFVASIAGNFTSGYNIDGALIDNFQIIASGAPLPLDVYSLKGKVIGKSSFLEWSSEITSQDIEQFDVYRYSSVSNDFEVIGSVKVSKPDQLGFQFLDENPGSGLNLYKVSALNWDGQTSFSNIAKVYHSTLGNVEVFPNPILAGQSLQIVLSGDQEISQISITDVTGKIIGNHQMEWDNYNKNLNFKEAGIYFAHISLTNGQKITSKIIVQL